MSPRDHYRAILSLPPTHPARRFLEAFLKCRRKCVGREIATPTNSPIDQAWFSAVDNKEWSFSKFAYTVLSFDVELDGWSTGSASITQSEHQVLNQLPFLRSLMEECNVAARTQNNHEIVRLVAQVNDMLDLWEQYITLRLKGVRASD